MAANAFQYDAFVSYRHAEPDRTWVRRRLCPALEAAGLVLAIDHRDFDLGAPVVLEMERAVVESRVTIAVLTPSYLNSTFTELENVMADTIGLEQGERRLFAVMREPCDAPLRMRARIYLDMAEDDSFDDGLARLVSAIKSLPVD